MATEITDPIARHREETLQRLIREARERSGRHSSDQSPKQFTPLTAHAATSAITSMDQTTTCPSSTPIDHAT